MEKEFEASGSDRQLDTIFHRFCPVFDGYRPVRVEAFFLRSILSHLEDRFLWAELKTYNKYYFIRASHLRQNQMESNRVPLFPLLRAYL